MILFILLTLITILLVAISIVIFAVGGTIGVILFGDVIVCVAILIWIIKKIFFKKKK